MAYLQPYNHIPLPKVQAALSPVPLPNGNTVNCNRIFKAIDGLVYFVDYTGNSIVLQDAEAKVYAPAGTVVTLDDLELRAKLGPGFEVQSTVPGWKYDIAVLGTYNTNDVLGANLSGVTITGSWSNPFGWAMFGPADMVRGTITAPASGRVYNFEVMLGAGPAPSYVSLQRKL